MKAITAVCATGASVPAIANGRIARHRDGENAEIQMYLSKLKDLVPHMPKNKKLSKLDIIQHVIDYICDLQSALESNPATAGQGFDAKAVLNASNAIGDTDSVRDSNLHYRQPLGVRSSPNTILNCNTNNSVQPTHSNQTTNDKDLLSDRSS